jgi:hypothetical protein
VSAFVHYGLGASLRLRGRECDDQMGLASAMGFKLWAICLVLEFGSEAL